MGLYRRLVLPRLIDAGMASEELTGLRAKVIPGVSGTVLEIGVGSGRNLPLYTSAVTKLYALEPSAELLAMAVRKAAPVPFPVEFLHRQADRVPLPDGSVDTAVSTWTLCSIADPLSALGEVRRVLTPGGVLVFIEHGLSPDAAVQTWQNRLTPIWRRIAGGCHLNRRIGDLIESTGFRIEELRTGYVRGPRLGTYMYEGRAVKSPSTMDDPTMDDRRWTMDDETHDPTRR